MIRRSLLTACAVAVAGMPVMALSKDVESDPIAKIAKNLPKNWKVELVSRYHDCRILIETNSMDTVPSLISDGEGYKKEPVWIELEVLPRYSAAMLKRIEEYNRPFTARLKSASHGSAERQSIMAKMIPYPMYQDADYSYIVHPSSQAPQHDEDLTNLRDVLRKVTSGWVAVDKDVTPVQDIPNFFNSK
jgi:hypothetical protein